MPPGFFRRMGMRLAAAPVPQIEITRPTEEELQQDQELVQKAISEAVTAALNNDAFTRSVAVHLATQLQPALKAALNISSVEESLSKRLDEIQTATTARLSDLSNDLNTYKSNDGTVALEEAVAKINASLVALGNDVTATQEQIAQQDTTILSVHTMKLDGIATGLKTLQEHGPAPVGLALSDQSTKLTELATDLRTVQERIASPDTSLLSSHTTKLDAIAAELVIVKENTDTTASLKSIIFDLASLKTEVESSATSSSTGLSGLTTQLTSIQAAIEAQQTTLSQINSADVSSEILAGVKASSEAHASHTAVLSKIASQDISADIIDLKSQIIALSNTVSETKSVDVTPEILSAVKSSNESHAAHASTLAEIKNVISAPSPVAEKVDLSIIERNIRTIISSIESQSTSLSEMKPLTSTPTEPKILAAIETLKDDAKASKDGITETKEQVKVLVDALSKSEKEQILIEVKAVKTAVEGIQIPKTDINEVISEMKAIRTLVRETKDAEILAEVKEIKVLVEKNGTVAKVEEVGEDDVIVEIEKAAENGSKGVESNEKVEA